MNEIVPREPAQTTADVDAPTGFRPSAQALDRLADARPESTRRAYRGDLRRFLNWATTVGLRHGRLLTIADENDMADPFLEVAHRAGADMPSVLVEYTNHLANRGSAPPTIDRAFSSILVAHSMAGVPKPDMTAPREVLRSWRRERAEGGAGVRKATPVAVDALRSMVATCDPVTVAGARDRCLLVIGFALGARRSELAGLDLGDVVETPEGLLVTIRTSKTDRDSVGRTVALPYGANPGTCPVRTFVAWRDVLVAAGRSIGPLFVRVDRHGVLGRAPSGRGSGDGRLTGQAVALVVRRAALAAGLDPGAVWTGHSLRRGFATETYRAGADPLRVARHGGWVDGSQVLLGYIEEVDRWQANPLARVGL